MSKIVDKKYLFSFALVASLFFFWGFAHSILDILNKHFQDALVISKWRSALVQAMVYGGYFIMALPAGAIIRKWGYKVGVITGLMLYGIGALLFIPGEMIMSFNFFLASLFVIAYGLGWIVGPLVGGLVVFSGEDGNSGSVSLPYAVIGVIVLIVAFVFSRIQLPEIVEQQQTPIYNKAEPSLWHSSVFVFGLVALFFYVAAQTGINSFFINYVTEKVPTVSSRTAALLLSFGGMGLFFVGRLLGSWLMNRIQASKVLLACAIGGILCMAYVILGSGISALVALVLTYLCEATMFPTIFALSLNGLGINETKRGSSFLIMSIVGGAIAPVLMGVIGETNMAIGFIIPLICFIVIALFACKLLR